MSRVFTKPALSVPQQLALLQKKHMRIADAAEAGHALRHIGFYHLSAYWFPYKTGAGAFQPGTDFHDILALYEFDRKLKFLLANAFERIEISVRENFIRALCLKYGPHGYLNWELYKTCSPLAKVISDISKELRKPNHLFTRHYKSSYNSPVLPPLWIAAELLSFGVLSKLIEDLKEPADRSAIAKIYQLDEAVFVPVLRHLTYMRNICAHHGRLWNQSVKYKPPAARRPAVLNQSLSSAISHKIYNSLCYIAYLHTVIAPQEPFKTDIKNLTRLCPASVDLARHMGFPENWQQRGLWR